MGTPDYFNDCNRGIAGVPYNWAGTSEAFDGNGYAGILCWKADQSYREYLQCRLIRKLIHDSVYVVSFRYRLSSLSGYSIDRIAASIDDNPITTNNDENFTTIPIVNVIQRSPLIRETGSWQLAQDTVRATGSEQFLTIGNFAANADTRSTRLSAHDTRENMLANSAYYYIDDVRIRLLSSLECPGMPISFETNRRYVINNLQFDVNSATIRQESVGQLDSLVVWLNDHAEINVVLTGHTDDAGSEQYNVKLSEARAASVAKYLRDRHIMRSRIKWEGYGKTKPLINLSDSISRQINRRVEFVLIKTTVTAED